MKSYFYLIPGITIATAVLGSIFSGNGMDWYKTINIPSFTPSGSIIGSIWTILFILTAISAILTWNTALKKKSLKDKLPKIALVFLCNALLNILWSFLFFNQHLILAAFLEAILLGFSVFILILLIRKINNLATLLLVPYLLWVFFAAYLTFIVWTLNR